MAKDYKDVNPYKEDINFSIKDINSSINELLEDVENTLDELYSKAYEKGRSDMINTDLNTLWYNQGLIDAWECAKKMVNMSIDDRGNIFNDDLMYLKDVFEKYSASESIQKIKEYEKTKEKQSNNEIIVGDEVITFSGHHTVVIAILNDGKLLKVIDKYGTIIMLPKNGVVKSNRHYDEIEKLFKKMKQRR